MEDEIIAPAEGVELAGEGEQATGQEQTGEVSGIISDNDKSTEEGAAGADDQAAQTSGDDAAGEASDGDGAVSSKDATSGGDKTAAAGGEQIPDKTQSEPAPQLEDPGEFKPKDYSFDVELADGTKLRITKPEDIDQLPSDADFGTPQNLMKVQAAFNKMVLGLDADKREWEASKAEFDKHQEESADLEQRVTSMINEMNYLETKGKLPKIDSKYEDADWADPEVAKQPGIAERLALLEYRAKENEERAKLGLSPMSVLEAHLQMQQDAAEQHAADEKKKQAEITKAKGGMVVGPTYTPPPSMPDDVIVAEGGNVRDIGR